MTDSLLHLSKIQKRYGRVVALDLDELELFAKEKVIVVGGNGCGKSTLLKILAGLTVPSSGSDVRQDGWRDASVGYLPQEGGIYQDLSVNQNLFAFERLFGRCLNASHQEEIADVLGLSQILDREVQGLSGGFKRLAAIYCLVVSNVNILLLDEPFASLDQAKQSSVEKALMMVANRLSLLVVSEHLNNLGRTEQSGFWSRKVELERFNNVAAH